MYAYLKMSHETLMIILKICDLCTKVLATVNGKAMNIYIIYFGVCFQETTSYSVSP